LAAHRASAHLQEPDALLRARVRLADVDLDLLDGVALLVDDRGQVLESLVYLRGAAWEVTWDAATRR
jgi:hypothetical protein